MPLALTHAATHYFSEFKASCLTLYLSHRCWSFEENVPPDFMNCSFQYFSDLFTRVRGYLSADTEAAKHRQLQLVYDSFSQLSLLNDVMRIRGVSGPLVATLTTNLGKVLPTPGQRQRLGVRPLGQQASKQSTATHGCPEGPLAGSQEARTQLAQGAWRNYWLPLQSQSGKKERSGPVGLRRWGHW